MRRENKVQLEHHHHHLRLKRQARLTSVRRWCESITLVTLCLSTSNARADFDFQFAMNLNGGWLRRTPAFPTKELTTDARQMGASRIASGRSVALLGMGIDVDLTIDDRYRVPIIGAAFASAIGSYDATITSVDGSIARLRPWTTFRMDIFLPGIGYRWKHRRTMWGAAIRSGVSFTGMEGTVAAGAEPVTLTLTAITFLAQIEIEGCRRLDPTRRVCLQVVPRIYEHEVMNGLTFGIRMELGQ